MTAGSRPLAGPIARSLVGAAGFRLTGALGGILAARLLGPTGRGQYGLLVVVATALGTAVTAGLHLWVARHVSGPHAGEVAPVIRRHLRHSTAALAAAVAAALVTASASAVGSPGELVGTGLLAFALAWSMLELAVPNGLLRMGAVAAITAANGSAFLVWMLLGLAAGAGSPAYAVVGAALANLVMVPLARRHRAALPSCADAAATPAAHARALRFGLPLGLGELLTFASFRLDVVLVAAYLAGDDVGLYAVAVALSELLLVIPDGVALVLLPYAAGHPGRTPTMRLVGIACATMGTAAAGLLLMAEPAVARVFGDDYRGAAVALPALLVGTMARGAWKMIGADAVARGDTTAPPASALLGLVAMVAADLVLIPRWGIAGAAAGSAIGSVLAAVAIAAHRRRGGPSARPAPTTTPVAVAP